MNYKMLFLLIFVVIAISCSKQIPTKALNIVSHQWPDTYIKNIKIDSSLMGAGACEPSICISPADPNIVIAGSILDRVYVSKDGGMTWDKSGINSTFGVYGDPVIRADYEGNFYYSHLASPGKPWIDEEFLDRIVVQKSTNNGLTWENGTHTPPGGKKDQDKQWLCIDPATNNVLMSWTEFDKYDSKDPNDKSRILFTISRDQGDTWSAPVAIAQYEGDCLDSDQTTEGAVPAVGPDGTIYVAWAYDEKIYLDYSVDGGMTWQDEDIIVADQPGGWDFDIPGIMRCNGMPILEIDMSNGPNRGTLYVNWSDQRNGTDDTDIWLAKSTDKGLTWSEPIRVNNDPAGKHQFFTWMDIDPMSGYIYTVFYDRRAHNDLSTDVYLAYSTDGGITFNNKKISEAPFKPNNIIFFGDYNDISAYDGKVRPIWTSLQGMQLSVWTALIDMKQNSY